MAVLTATLRLQLHREFTFTDAAAWVPYYHALGISHLYLSPIATAKAGSTHGYDVIDPTVINPELGGEQGFVTLVHALHAQDMGVILDIVPNHMAAALSNTWWMDVLGHGRHSQHARYFDIEWDHPACAGKLCLPVLGEPLADALAKGTITVEPFRGENQLGIRIGDALYPASAESVRWLEGGDPAGTLATSLERLRTDSAAMREFLDLQHYRFTYWRDSADTLNYRRFFDINELVALAMHDEAVFDAVHALPLRLVRQGLVDGLRVDHIDGLADPSAYLKTLRHRLDACARTDETGAPVHLTLYVEKILAEHEEMPDDWPIDGTTGYDFMHEMNVLLHDPQGYTQLLGAWRAAADGDESFALTERVARRELLDGSLRPDLLRCARAMQRAIGSLSPPATPAVDLPQIEAALRELLAHVSVYRTYLGDSASSAHDANAIDGAVKQAWQGDVRLEPVRALIHTCLLAPSSSQATALACRHARIRFEQLSSALNAKAVEDTGFYRFAPLLSLNEVGGKPQALPPQPQRFHQAMQARAARWPLSLSALSTHDHKRGADTRARLAVLSEHAAWFIAAFDTWMAELGPRERPSRHACWTLFQTLLGAWPLALEATDSAGLDVFAQRVQPWLIKAEREAKQHTSWTDTNEVYEKACRDLVQEILQSAGMAPLRERVCAAARSLDAAGALNGLAAATLQLTAPGIPDIYQGTEYWDLSLVDPDNRLPVDYRHRQRSLELDVPPDAWLAEFRGGELKQQVIHRLLQLRKAWSGLFEHGSYEPLQVTGERAGNVVAFLRRHGEHHLVVAVPRLCGSALWQAATPLPDVAFWGNTRLAAVNHDTACTFTDLFSQVKRGSDPRAWSAATLFAHWPVCVMISASGNDECKTIFCRPATPHQ